MFTEPHITVSPLVMSDLLISSAIIMGLSRVIWVGAAEVMSMDVDKN